MKRALPVGIALLAAPLALRASGTEQPQDMGHLMTVLVLQLAAIVVAARLFGLVFSRYLN